jgi:3-hydroxyacyl-CoA dehydrogenase
VNSMGSGPFTSISLPRATSITGLGPIQLDLRVPIMITEANSARIWAAIKREALLTISEGVASPTEVDAIFKEVLKTPKGPCEQMDVVGLDVVLDIEEHYAETRDGLPQAPRELLRKMIAENKLGVKSGNGFYNYNVNRKIE